MKPQFPLLYLIAVLFMMGNVANAQIAPIDFESEGHGANWTWTTFENGTNPPLAIIPNPSVSGINTSATVASFTALTTGQPWAGCESQHGADIGTFSFNVSNAIVKVMVYKSVISDVGIKFAEANGEAQPEVKVANTLINEWEELTFDLSGSIGVGATGIIDQIIVFPDFDLAGRSTDNICYFDNITFTGEELPPQPAAQAPIPTELSDDVTSIFSDSYSNISGTNFYPGWGQTTVVTEVLIEGNNTLFYNGLDYQGIELGSVQDVSGMDSLHVDFWSTNSTTLQVFLISESSGEQAFTFEISNDTWVSTDIPLTVFSNLGLALSDIYQLKFVGDGDVYLDNLYFVGEGTGLVEAPYAPIDFESEGYGADWTWTSFENGTNPPLTMVANPSASGINTSATVASYTTLTTGAAWAGCESQHGADIGAFSFSPSNSLVKMMVYKSVISDVGIKFAEANGDAQPEVKVANTLINEWEELTFDLSGSIGAGATGIVDQIIIFPDFDLNGRTSDNTVYFDNITFSAQEMPTVPVAHAPVPNTAPELVNSVFSDVYSNIAGTNFNPGWGQATQVSEVLIEGNNTLLYSGLNYQGTEFPAQNITEMTHLHIDFWTSNSSVLKFFVISQTPTVDSDYHDFSITPEQWVSVDIPMTAYPNVDLTDVFQFKVEGNGTVYWDNIYFHTSTVSVDERNDVTPQSFTLEQNSPNPFNPETNIRFSLRESGHVVLKVYNINGQLVSKLLDDYVAAGQHRISFSGVNLPSGSYFYALETAGETSVRKMLLIR